MAISRPVWDGLARTSQGEILLIEAKAHIPEIVSPRSRASEPARGRIAKSMRDVQQAVAPKSVGFVDWTSTFYQYANRVAHLHFLQQAMACAPIWSTCTSQMPLTLTNGPTDRAEWHGAVKVVECYLGLGRTSLTNYMHKVFVDAAPLVLSPKVTLDRTGSQTQAGREAELPAVTVTGERVQLSDPRWDGQRPSQAVSLLFRPSRVTDCLPCRIESKGACGGCAGSRE